MKVLQLVCVPPNFRAAAAVSCSSVDKRRTPGIFIIYSCYKHTMNVGEHPETWHGEGGIHDQTDNTDGFHWGRVLQCVQGTASGEPVIRGCGGRLGPPLHPGLHRGAGREKDSGQAVSSHPLIHTVGRHQKLQQQAETPEMYKGAGPVTMTTWQYNSLSPQQPVIVKALH